MKLTVVVILFILTFLFLVGCDGTMNLHGAIYEWINAPSDSQGEIIIDQDVPEASFLRPIAGVTIRFRFSDMSIEESIRRFNWSVVTDSTGKFSGGWVVDPKSNSYIAWINQQGYYPLEKTFTHVGSEGRQRSLNVLLVRNPFTK